MPEEHLALCRVEIDRHQIETICPVTAQRGALCEIEPRRPSEPLQLPAINGFDRRAVRRASPRLHLDEGQAIRFSGDDVDLQVPRPIIPLQYSIARETQIDRSYGLASSTALEHPLHP